MRSKQNAFLHIKNPVNLRNRFVAMHRLGGFAYQKKPSLKFIFHIINNLPKFIKKTRDRPYVGIFCVFPNLCVSCWFLFFFSFFPRFLKFKNSK